MAEMEYWQTEEHKQVRAAINLFLDGLSVEELCAAYIHFNAGLMLEVPAFKLARVFEETKTALKKEGERKGVKSNVG